MRIGHVLSLVLVAMLPAVAQAEQHYLDVEKRLTPEQMRATGLDSLTAEQRALLNSLLRDETEKTIEAVKLETRSERSPQHIGLDDQAIESRIKGVVDGWEVGMVFELDNGQQWKVLKGKANLRVALHDPQVLVVPGIAGRWFLQFDENMPKARVYRVD